MRLVTIVALLVTLTCSAQFDRAGGKPGSKSVHKDASSIVGWASSATLQRGYMQINDTTLGKATIGTEMSAVGTFDGDVVSLGDGGVITLSFSNAIIDNEGFDFAIFENGFEVGLSYYLELAHVEVSLDGVTFIRFPSESLTDTAVQINNFSYLEPTSLYNLAGKHQAPYGTLFDLSEVGLDTVRFVRLIDVIGAISDSIGSRDSKGRIINDPWPSPFGSSGFDLDAVAIVNGVMLRREEQMLNQVRIYPSLAFVNEPINVEAPQGAEVIVLDLQGRNIQSVDDGQIRIDRTGIYVVWIQFEGDIYTRKIVIR